MHSLMVDIQPLITALAGVFVGWMACWRYKEMKEFNRVERVARVFGRFANVATRDDNKASAHAYKNAEHVMRRMLQDGVEFPPDEEIVSVPLDDSQSSA